MPLSKLIDLAEPMGSAKYVAFHTLLDPDRMPGQTHAVLDWPYVPSTTLRHTSSDKCVPPVE
jgi:sulfoxide reductase catalytic subunit YedY